jgi:hypothetical protein
MIHSEDWLANCCNSSDLTRKVCAILSLLFWLPDRFILSGGTSIFYRKWVNLARALLVWHKR